MYKALLLTASLTLFGCGGSSDTDTDDAASTPDSPGPTTVAVLTCDDLCTAFDYDGFTEDSTQPYEYHCLCDGANGTEIDPSTCNDLCLELGWSGGYVDPAECWCA